MFNLKFKLKMQNLYIFLFLSILLLNALRKEEKKSEKNLSQSKKNIGKNSCLLKKSLSRKIWLVKNISHLAKI